MYWINNEKTKFIVIDDNGIFCGNPSLEKKEHFTTQLKKGEVPSELLHIPFAYIKEINTKDIDNDINILFGNDSSEILTINNQNQKSEIFELLKNSLPKFTHQTQEINKFKAAKKPFIALVLFTIICAISFHTAIQLENNELEGRYIALILVIAEFGSETIIKIYLGILAISSFAIFRKMSQAHTLDVIKK